MESQPSFERQYLDEELRKSFSNINYAQWERKKSGDAKQLKPLIRKLRL